MTAGLRKSGIDVVGAIPWGTHFCQFYQTQADLVDVLVSYFTAGLEDNEFCMWVTAHPLMEIDAAAAMRRAVPGFDACLERGQIEIVPYSEWYLKGGAFDSRRVLDAWVDKLSRALERGYSGLRLSGNTFWLEKTTWGDFLRYEDEINTVVGRYRMLALCTYSLDRCGAGEIIDVVNTHQFALAKRDGAWNLIESSAHKRAAEALRERTEELESILDALPAFVWIGHDPECAHITGNRMANAMTRTPKDANVSQTAAALGEGVYIRQMKENGAEYTFAELPMQRAVARRRPVHDAVVDFRFPDGRRTQIVGNAVPLFDPGGKVRGVVGAFVDITARKKAEEDLRRRVAILDGINRVFREALACETEEQLGRFCLTIAERMTESAFGFIGKIGPDGKLHDIAISDPGWELCTMYDKSGHRRAPVDFTIHGLYGRPMLDRSTVLTNDPGSHPDSIGTPAGHPPIAAFLGTPLIHGGRVIGLVGLANRAGGYGAEQAEIMESLGIAITQVLVYKEAEEALRSSLAEKDVLMRELAHRTKNNMQVVSSMIGMQALASGSESVVAALTDTQDRIRAMALVHEKMYRSRSLASVDMRDYVTDLMQALLHAHAVSPDAVALSLDVAALRFPIDAALHCGLIINELVSNSLKYAFPAGTRGTIFLGLRRDGKETELRFRDDGPGLPRDLDLAGIKTLGLKLVYNLAVRQLRGTIELRHDPVTEFVLRFRDFSHPGTG